jgi:hypothetical protein
MQTRSPEAGPRSRLSTRRSKVHLFRVKKVRGRMGSQVRGKIAVLTWGYSREWLSLFVGPSRPLTATRRPDDGRPGDCLGAAVPRLRPATARFILNECVLCSSWLWPQGWPYR